MMPAHSSGPPRATGKVWAEAADRHDQGKRDVSGGTHAEKWAVKVS